MLNDTEKKIMDPTDEFMAEVARNAERAGKEHAADLAAGRARIGGRLRQPNYLRSYLKAARILVQQARASDALNELAVACAYLQRHALELAIKDLLDTLHTIADYTAHLDALNHETASTAPIPADERSRKTSCHDLEALRSDLDAALQRQAAGHDPIQMPPDLALLVSEFARIERKRPERFRYPTVPRQTQQGIPKAKGQRPRVVHEQSFRKAVVIPVEDLQTRLEALTVGLFGNEDDDPLESLGGELSAHLDWLFHELYARGAFVAVTPDTDGEKP